jgi:predicted aspartyl protease
VAQTFTFESAHFYDTAKSGIEIGILLHCGERHARVNAKLDTGSSFCVFERAVAKALEIDVEGGSLMFISTATGQFKAYGHWVTIETLGYEVESMVSFAADETLKRNVLGRQGWIDRFKLCLVEHDGAL